MDSFSDITRAAERRRILEMVERGQISAAEADELMIALEGRSANEEPEPTAFLRFSAHRTTSVPGPVAALASVARALARTIAHLSLALGGIVSVLARVSGRARRLWQLDRGR